MGIKESIITSAIKSLLPISKGTVFAACYGACALSSAAHAQDSGTVNTQVVTPLTVTNQTGMNFGRITSGALVSEIRIRRNNNGLNIRAGDALPLGGTSQRAEFTIAAEPLTSVQITLPQNINIQNGNGDTMLVRRFRLNGGGGRIVSRSIDNSGGLSIFVSAQLRIQAAQNTGVYSGNYDVTVEYN